MENKNNQENKRMVPAVIEQIILWIVLFISFVSFLFMVIDYGNIMRVKGNIDLMAEYGARMFALGKTTDEVAASLNNIKINYFAPIDGDTIECTQTENGNYQILFTVSGGYDEVKVLEKKDDIISKKVVFNERNSNEIDCSLTLTKQ